MSDEQAEATLMTHHSSLPASERSQELHKRASVALARIAKPLARVLALAAVPQDRFFQGASAAVMEIRGR
jgi:hypothetical protein